MIAVPVVLHFFMRKDQRSEDAKSVSQAALRFAVLADFLQTWKYQSNKRTRALNLKVTLHKDLALQIMAEAIRGIMVAELKRPARFWMNMAEFWVVEMIIDLEDHPLHQEAISEVAIVTT